MCLTGEGINDEVNVVRRCVCVCVGGITDALEDCCVIIFVV